MREHCTPSESAGALLQSAMDRLALSARAYDKVLRVARTIADLDEAYTISEAHVAESVQYRSLDRECWQRNRVPQWEAGGWK